MAQERPLTPEKQLLSLIENSKAKDAGVEAHIVKDQASPLFSGGVWRSRYFFFKDGFKRWFAGGGFHRFDVKFVNKILFLFIIILGFYFMSELYYYLMNFKKGSSLKMTAESGTKEPASYKEASVLKRTPAYYLDRIRERDIFKMGAKAMPEESAAPSVTPAAIIEATQHLRLVGISWSSDPDAMIEDTKAMRTFFVKRGQVMGQIRIEAIFKDKVVLSYGGEEVELK